MPIKHIRDEPYPDYVVENLEKLAAEFPDWDFWWTSAFGHEYCAGPPGERGKIFHRTPDGIAEQITRGKER